MCCYRKKSVGHCFFCFFPTDLCMQLQCSLTHERAAEEQQVGGETNTTREEVVEDALQPLLLHFAPHLTTASQSVSQSAGEFIFHNIGASLTCNYHRLLKTMPVKVRRRRERSFVPSTTFILPLSTLL